MLQSSYRTGRAQDYGAFTNALGILSADKKSILPQNLLKVTGLGPSDIAVKGGVSRPQLYKKAIPLKISSKFIKRVVDIVMVTDLAFELFDGNQDETAAWLMSPNSLLFGDSPFEVCMRGDGEPLKKWLLERLDRKPIEL
ncbi:MAG: DUF2384 domain-containing protein [Bdellovibrionaceae bacterium]|nr:DUF2384 domain-containing protein [Pseudobdellovibrionaceae bacterium]